MGQYYRPISLEKLECVSPYAFDNGAKLIEHSWLPNEFVRSIETLIAEGGKWYGDRIVWAGDYADPEKDENGNDRTFEYEGRQLPLTLYRITNDNAILPDKVKRPIYRYLINMDTKEFVDFKKVPDVDGWILHPLPFLTCEGNGQGGGDFYGKDPEGLVGKWARNRITISTRKPKDHTELVFDLVK
jgi:hypothetical protein